MKIEIKQRWSGNVLFSLETESLKLCVEAAVKSRADLEGAYLKGADLEGAYLEGADLEGADLEGAYLKGAYLKGADLKGAYLEGADLEGAYLKGADLEGAYLKGADLEGADLKGADLKGADLKGADLEGADLEGADLEGADLKGAKNYNKYLICPLLILKDQPDKIRAYKLVDEKMYSPMCKQNGYDPIKFVIGKTIEVLDADTSETKLCSSGINVATLDWCLKNREEWWKILIVEFTAKDIASIPTTSDGKFRLFRCTVVGEKKIKELA